MKILTYAGTISSPPPSQLLQEYLLLPLTPRFLFSRTLPPALGSQYHIPKPSLKLPPSPLPYPPPPSPITVKDKVKMHHPLCRRERETQRSSLGLIHTKGRKALSTSQEDGKARGVVGLGGGCRGGGVGRDGRQTKRNQTPSP